MSGNKSLAIIFSMSLAQWASNGSIPGHIFLCVHDWNMTWLSISLGSTRAGNRCTEPLRDVKGPTVLAIFRDAVFLCLGGWLACDLQ
jgi:hypothetical protein